MRTLPCLEGRAKILRNLEWLFLSMPLLNLSCAQPLIRITRVESEEPGSAAYSLTRWGWQKIA
jgi:hypothetical protein